MIQELIYTSAPSGLKPGSRGYCTVASSRGMSRPMSEMLESLSGYRHIHPPETPEATHNPVAWSYVRTKVGGQKAYILSRVADAGLDYSGRSNKLAHHVVLEKPDLPDSGPAACLASNKLTIQSWESDARVLPTRDLPNVGQHPSKDMTNWQSLAGDENWCHYLLNELRKKKPVYIIYALGTDVLPLFEVDPIYWTTGERFLERGSSSL